MNQLSMFDIFPEENELTEDVARHYSIQASSAETTRSYHVFGTVRDIAAVSSFDVPTLIDRFPLIAYYLRNEYLGRDKIVDVMFSELDEHDKFLRKYPDFWLKIPATKFYDVFNA